MTYDAFTTIVFRIRTAVVPYFLNDNHQNKICHSDPYIIPSLDIMKSSNLYEDESLRALPQEYQESSNVTSIILGMDAWPTIQTSVVDDSFEWHEANYFLELNFQQAYRGALVVAMRNLENKNINATSWQPLAIRISPQLSAKLLPLGKSLPYPPHATYLAYREDVVKEMWHITHSGPSLINNNSNSVITDHRGDLHKSESNVHARTVVTNPMDAIIQTPFLIYQGCHYRLRYELPPELKAIPTNTIDAMVQFNSHLKECIPPAVIKVAGFIASQVAPGNFVRATNQYYAYRNEVIEMLPSLIGIPIDQGIVYKFDTSKR